MIFELAGVIVAGVVAALLTWALSRWGRGRVPGWLTPVAAGAVMLAAAISLEYGWYERTRATMPESLVVAQAIEAPSPLRPWTYAAPFVSRYFAVDRASIRTHPDRPGERLVDLVFYGRWARPAKVPVLLDCAGGRRADVVDGIAFAADGAVEGAEWRDLPADDPVLVTACAAA
jgi:hypothetical protein